jgi:hypothetical protein
MAMTLERITPILPVRTVAGALTRYRRLGFEAKPYIESGVSTEDDPIYGYLKWGAAEIHLARYVELDPKTNTSACYLFVDDADAFHAQWSQAGVEGRLRPPEDKPYGLREFGYVDPDGNLLRVGSQVRSR